MWDEQINKIPDVLHDYIFSGGISKGGSWGGEGCQKAIDLRSHSIELVLWFIICYFLYNSCQYKEHYDKLLITGEVILNKHKRTTCSMSLDRIFSILHFGIWGLVLYYKINMHSLINLFQPCHILLFVQGLGVLIEGKITFYNCYLLQL